LVEFVILPTINAIFPNAICPWREDSLITTKNIPKNPHDSFTINYFDALNTDASSQFKVKKKRKYILCKVYKKHKVESLR
jgi:hypothetical protein